jgi:aspartate dehydrogenase
MEDTFLAPRGRIDGERRIRVVLLGLGAINRRVASLLQSRQSGVDIVGAIVRRPDRAASALPTGAVAITSAAELVAASPELILEAASGEAVREWGDAALRTARRFIVSSSSAFVDDCLLRNLRDMAKRHGSQLILSPGALAGVDALSAAARIGMQSVHHRIVKMPSSWATGTGQNLPPPDSSAAVAFFRGSAREAAARYPLNANVTAVTALSGIGLDKTTVELVSDPMISNNRHEVQAIGDFGSLTITIENRALRSNPRSSELAALALVRLAEIEVSEFAQ